MCTRSQECLGCVVFGCGKGLSARLLGMQFLSKREPGSLNEDACLWSFHISTQCRDLICCLVLEISTTAPMKYADFVFYSVFKEEKCLNLFTSPLVFLDFPCRIHPSSFSWERNYSSPILTSLVTHICVLMICRRGRSYIWKSYRPGGSGLSQRGTWWWLLKHLKWQG